MSETSAEDLRFARESAITAYATQGLGLILWTLLLIRIVATKAGLHVLILISVLMILYSIIVLAGNQYFWTKQKKSYEGIQPFFDIEKLTPINSGIVSLL